MFLTTPSRTSPSCSWLTSSVRCSARLSSRMARRRDDDVAARRSILRIGNGWSLPISGPTSRTGRMSTWVPGRKAEAPPRSTVKPPFTRPKMAPSTGSLSVNALLEAGPGFLAAGLLAADAPPRPWRSRRARGTPRPCRRPGPRAAARRRRTPSAARGLRSSGRRRRCEVLLDGRPLAVDDVALEEIASAELSSSMAAKSSARTRVDAFAMASSFRLQKCAARRRRRAPPGLRLGLGLQSLRTSRFRRRTAARTARSRALDAVARARANAASAHRVRSCRASRRRAQRAAARPPRPRRGVTLPQLCQNAPRI